MMGKVVPFTKAQALAWSTQHQTPFYVYDEAGIRTAARELQQAFSWIGFKEYFAVKATPTPAIISLLAEEGCGADCSSMAELLIAERIGLRGERIMFSSNNTPAEEYVKARALGAVINLDGLEQLDFLERCAGLPAALCFRYNPGGGGGNVIIGTPEESKFGMTKEQLIDAVTRAHAKGVKRLGIHCMIASNSLEVSHFSLQAHMVFTIINECADKGIPISFVNFGGGVGIPYRPEQERLSFAVVSSAIRAEYEACRMQGLELCMELGRAITGPHGYLITRVRHLKSTYKRYVGVDATMANLMRPALYGAYHHITVLGKEHFPHDRVYDVVGGLCENNDKFAINRALPCIEEGDILAIHDAGAHGYAMGFNYNGKLRCAELLLHAGDVELIRRAETFDDYFATMLFPQLVEKY
jgi:diaminopimelate decarboxylase